MRTNIWDSVQDLNDMMPTLMLTAGSVRQMKEGIFSQCEPISGILFKI